MMAVYGRWGAASTDRQKVVLFMERFLGRTVVSRRTHEIVGISSSRSGLDTSGRKQYWKLKHVRNAARNAMQCEKCASKSR
jgi:hypothetical protein